MESLQTKNIALETVLLVCDNASCHARLEAGVREFRGLQVLRLGPYSLMLNPIENIWSKLKAGVQRNNRVPEVVGPAVGAQRLEYLEQLLRDSVAEITASDKAQCA